MEENDWIVGDASVWQLTMPSDWQCELFGTSGMIFIPQKGQEPNAFWRLMQYLILGNKWRRVGKHHG